MTSSRSGAVSIHINASPDAVWDVLADIERMGDWSPECYRVRWLGDARAPATKGARFKGWNKSGWLRWTMTCEVIAADPSREVAWATVRGGREIIRWRYRMVPSDGGTQLTESFEAVRWPLDVRFFEDVVIRDRDRQREQAMRMTLERIKAVAE